MAELERQSTEPGFWGDRESAQSALQQLSGLKTQIERWKGPRGRLDDLMVLAELAEEEDDETVAGEIEAGIKSLMRDIEKLEFQLLLSGEYDKNSDRVDTSRRGGTESQDWAEMLLRVHQVC